MQKSICDTLDQWEEPAVTALVFVMVGIVSVLTYPARLRDRICFRK